MPIEFWNTLAVDDVERARAFYTAVGFRVKNGPAGPAFITVHPNETTTICLFPRPMFAGMVPGGVCDTAKAHELVQSISVASRGEVDAMVARAQKAGGRVAGAPGDAPWGYGGGFADPDGHVWAVLFMPRPGT